MGDTRYLDIMIKMSPKKLARLLIVQECDSPMVYICPDGLKFDTFGDKDGFRKAIDHTESWLMEVV